MSDASPQWLVAALGPGFDPDKGSGLADIDSVLLQKATGRTSMTVQKGMLVRKSMIVLKSTNVRKGMIGLKCMAALEDTTGPEDRIVLVDKTARAGKIALGDTAAEAGIVGIVGGIEDSALCHSETGGMCPCRVGQGL